jgi:hypothetical protein
MMKGTENTVVMSVHCNRDYGLPKKESQLTNNLMNCLLPRTRSNA